MSNIQKMNISILKNQKERFSNERTNFNNNAHSTFSYSYLKNCSDYHVTLMGNKLSNLYNEIFTGYKKIDSWWQQYNNNIEALENYLSGKGNLGSITESSIRGFVNPKLGLLEDYQKKSEMNFKVSKTDTTFSMETVINDFSNLFSDYKDVGNIVNEKLNNYLKNVDTYVKADAAQTTITSNLLYELGKKGLEKFSFEVENIMNKLSKPVSDTINNTNAYFIDNNLAHYSTASDWLYIINTFTEASQSNKKNQTKENDFLKGIKNLYNKIVEVEAQKQEINANILQSQMDKNNQNKENISSGFNKIWDTLLQAQMISMETDMANTQAHVEKVNSTRKNIGDIVMQAQLMQIQNDIAQAQMADETAATMATVGVSILEGLGKLGGGIIDGTLNISAICADAQTYNQYLNGYITEEQYEAMGSAREFIRPFVEKEHVKGFFDAMYEKTRFGQYIKDNSYGYETVREVTSGISYGIGAMLFAGGNPLVASSIYGLAGVGKATEEAWNNEATTEEGSLYGLAAGGWEFLQYYVGAKIGMDGGWGNKIVDYFAKSSSTSTKQVLTSLTRICLDGVDGSLEGFVQPKLQSIYKEGTYEELFTANGGWDYVKTNGLMGAGSSIVGEMFDFGKLMKNTEVEINEASVKNTIDADNSIKAKIEEKIENIKARKNNIDSNKLTLADLKYNALNVGTLTWELLKSSFRRYVYFDTSSIGITNDTILNHDLYHFTTAADAILDSGYIKPSNMVTSYGNEKTFFFAGVPEVGAFGSNLDNIPLKTTAVRVEASVDLIRDPKLKVRSIDDGAITYDGRFDLEGTNSSKEYFCLFKENDELVYKSVSKDFYDNYENTESGKIIADFVKKKSNIFAIEQDYLVKLSQRNTKAFMDLVPEKVSQVFKLFDNSPQLAFAGTGATISLSSFDDVLDKFKIFKSKDIELEEPKISNIFKDDPTDDGAISLANFKAKKGITTLFRFNNCEGMPDINSPFWVDIKNRDLTLIEVNGKIMDFEDAMSYKAQYDFTLRDSMSGVNDTNLNSISENLVLNEKAPLLTKFTKSSKDPFAGAQGSCYEKYKKIFKTEQDKLEIKIFEDTIRKYYPQMSKKEISQFLKRLEEHGCSYVAISSSIFEQLDYDKDLFKQMFGFDMYLPDGSLNHDQLILDIFASTSKMIEVDYNKANVTSYKTWTEAYEDIIGDPTMIDNPDNHSLEKLSMIKLFEYANKNKISILADDYGNIIKKEYAGIKSIIDTPENIIEKLLGVKVEAIGEKDLIKLLNENNISSNIKSNIDGSKIFSSRPGAWINSYFKSHNIDMKFDIFKKHGSLLEFNELIKKYNEGYSIEVSAKPNVPISMTDGTKLGWVTFGDKDSGHAMIFRGITDNNDIIVSSWGKHYMIPKEYVEHLEFNFIKKNTEINNINIDVNNKHTYVENVYNSSYNQSFTDKIKGIFISPKTNSPKIIDLENKKIFKKAEELAEYFNDPKQYLYQKLKKYVEMNPNDIELAQYLNDINSTMVISINEKDLLSKVKKILTTDEKNILQKLMKNRISHTELEEDLICSYTFATGPAITSYLRNAQINYKGTIFDGTNKKMIQDTLNSGHKMSMFNRYYGNNSMIKKKISKIIDIDDFIKKMDKMIEKSTPLQENIVVYRGCDGLFFNNDKINIIDIKPGTKINDPAYISTSLLEDNICMSYDIQLEITVPIGTKAKYLETITGVHKYGQQELLLDRNTTFEITSYPILDPITRKYKIEARVI